MEKNNIRGSQHYIGTPTGAVLCVDAVGEEKIDALCWHGYSEEPVAVTSLTELMFRLEELYNLVGFPQSATNERWFHPPVRNRDSGLTGERMLTDAELLSKLGAAATFVIRVYQRQNSTWQGSLTWVEKNQSLIFNSVIELVRHIISALKAGQSEELPDDPYPEQ